MCDRVTDAFGWGRVYQIIGFRQLLLVKPAPTSYSLQSLRAIALTLNSHGTSAITQIALKAIRN